MAKYYVGIYAEIHSDGVVDADSPEEAKQTAREKILDGRLLILEDWDPDSLEVKVYPNDDDK